MKQPKTNIGKKNKGGRPRKPVIERIEEKHFDLETIEKLIIMGFSESEVAGLLKMSLSEFESLKIQDSEFRNMIELAKTKPYIKYRKTKKRGNPETIKKYAQKYYSEHKQKYIIQAVSRRHKKENLPIGLTEKDWNESLKYFDNSCAYCGSGTNLNKEHVIPLSKGGGFIRTNIIPACAPCNQSKKTLNVFDWYRSTPFFSNGRFERIIAWQNQ